jgi:uncharacterized coiled-coil protein SlyX
MNTMVKCITTLHVLIMIGIDMEQRILQLENLLHKQEVEIRRLSNAIERMSTAITAVRMNETRKKK